jgi:heat shock protein HslJ
MMRRIAVAAVAVAVAACAPAPETGSAPDAGEGNVAGQGGIENVEWRLASLNGSPIVVAGNRVPTLTLASAEKRATGLGGCNRYFASYFLEGDALRFNDIGSTRMACTENGVMALETAYFEALRATETFALAGSSLTLSGRGRTVARFTRAR